MDLQSSKRKCALLTILKGTVSTQTQEASGGQKQDARSRKGFVTWAAYNTNEATT